MKVTCQDSLQFSREWKFQNWLISDFLGLKSPGQVVRCRTEVVRYRTEVVRCRTEVVRCRTEVVCGEVFYSSEGRV
jgi:hypothetical protein